MENPPGKVTAGNPVPLDNMPLRSSWSRAADLRAAARPARHSLAGAPTQLPPAREPSRSLTMLGVDQTDVALSPSFLRLLEVPQVRWLLALLGGHQRDRFGCAASEMPARPNKQCVRISSWTAFTDNGLRREPSADPGGAATDRKRPQSLDSWGTGAQVQANCQPESLPRRQRRSA